MRTNKFGTLTTEGMIPHYPIRMCGQNVLCPVKLEFSPLRGVVTTQPPLRDSQGRLVYALPGGRSFAP
jgi:hypothetical protein